jgi:branched-chain amino acid transport system substrate-binding protein
MKEGNMRKSVLIACIVMTSVFILTLVGPAAVAAKEKEVVIGYIGPLTGGAAFLGVDCLNGLRLAVDDINAAGGITVGGTKYLLRIEHHDDEATPAKGVAGFRRLKDRFNIPVVVNNISGTAVAITEINERLDVLWTGFAIAPIITNRGNKLVLRTYPDSSVTVAVAINALVKLKKPKTFAVLADASDYGRAQESLFKSGLLKKGLNHLATEWFDQRKDSDFRVLASKIIALKPDAVVVIAYDEATGQVIRQLREMGLTATTVTSEGFQSKGIAIAKPVNLEGRHVGAQGPVAFNPPPNSLADYRKKYRERFKAEPASYGENNYELLWIIARGMEKAGSVTDPRKIKEGMKAVVPIEKNRRTGWIEKWDNNGNVTMWLAEAQFLNGGWHNLAGKRLAPPEYK